MSQDLKAAVAAGVGGSEELFRSLLQSIVDVAMLGCSPGMVNAVSCALPVTVPKARPTGA